MAHPLKYYGDKNIIIARAFKLATKIHNIRRHPTIGAISPLFQFYPFLRGVINGQDMCIDILFITQFISQEKEIIFRTTSGNFSSNISQFLNNLMFILLLSVKCTPSVYLILHLQIPPLKHLQLNQVYLLFKYFNFCFSN